MVPALPTWRTVLNVVVAVVVVLVVTPFIVYAVPSVVGAEASYVVISGSMEPTIRTGDVVVMNEVDPATVSEGDVIAYQLQGEDRPTTHRVVAVRENAGPDGSLAFQTKGDANEDPDQRLVPAGNLVGRLMTVRGHPVIIPYAGYVVQFVGTREGFLALVVAPFALLVASEAWGLVRSVRGSAGESREAGSPSGEDTDTVPDGPVALEAATETTPGSPTTSGTEVAANGEPADEELVVVPADRTARGDEGDELRLTRTDLKLTLPVLVAFFGYSAWTTYAGPSALSIGLTVGTGMTLLVVSGLFVTTGSRASTVTHRTTSATDDENSGPDKSTANATEDTRDALDVSDGTGIADSGTTGDPTNQQSDGREAHDE